jgi:Ca-activated chloride channel family protein
VSEHLVREVARASRGEVEMIAPGERIEPKVLRQFGRVRSPALSDVKVDWGGLEVEQAPRVVPPGFRGELLTVWARVRAGSASEATLTAGGQRWTVPLDLERAPTGGPVPALWGRAAIRDLEADDGRHGSSQQRPGKERRKNDKLIEIGKTLGLVSSATSYVAVELRAEGDRTTEQGELRRVPIALTAGWGGGPGGVMRPQARFGQGAMPPPAPMGMRRAMMHAPAASAPMSRAASKASGAMAGAAGVFGKLAQAIGGGRARGDKMVRSKRRDGPVEELRELDAGVSDASPGDAGAERDALYAILLTQAADGSFPVSDALLAAVQDAMALTALRA